MFSPCRPKPNSRRTTTSTGSETGWQPASVAVEFARTIEIMRRTLPPAPAVVADIGGGPGRYTDWLVANGYQVIHRDVVPHHVDQVRDRHGNKVDAAVGSAVALDIDDGAVDVVLLLGPLYHLADPGDRAAAIAESARITRGGGLVHAAAIGRWSPRIHGLIRDRLYEKYPDVLPRLLEVEQHGVLPAIFDGAFNGYTHTPDQLRAEMTTNELDLESLLGIEGPASVFSDEIIDARMASDVDRTMLFDSLRALEAVPELLGVSPHLLATARRVG